MTRQQQILSMVTAELKQHSPLLHNHRVLLFGSRARGTAADRSDFDLGVYGDEQLPLEAFHQLADHLDNLPTLFQIDFVDLNRAPEQLRQEALAEGKVIYE